jgi:hypothetical protein
MPLVLAAPPAAAQGLSGMSGSPEPGSVHTTRGYCLSPEVHDDLIEALMNEGEAAAVEAYEEAKMMGACIKRKAKARYLERTYRFDWPDRPNFAGEQWFIRLLDTEQTAHILIMVRKTDS